MFKFINRYNAQFLLDLSLSKQLVLILGASAFIVLIFSFLMNSLGFGILIFIDPGNYANAFDAYPVIGMIEAIIGILFSGALISSITTSFIQWTENTRLKSLHELIEEAFQTHSSIKIRKLLEELHLNVESRNLSIIDAEIRLEIARDDIVKTIRQYRSSRLRRIKNDDTVVIENFGGNTEYGTYQNNNSDITIISTQSYSDAGIGHFTNGLAQSLDANYISNEFYSTGAPLKKLQLNFANNERYLTFQTPNETDALGKFKQDIISLSHLSDLFIYMGTSNGEREHDIHLLFGGAKGEIGFSLANTSYRDTTLLKNFYDVLHHQLTALGLKVATHEEFDNTSDIHLSQAIARQLNKNVLTIYVSTKILWGDEEGYYKVLSILRDSIKNQLLEEKEYISNMAI